MRNKPCSCETQITMETEQQDSQQSKPIDSDIQAIRAMMQLHETPAEDTRKAPPPAAEAVRTISSRRRAPDPTSADAPERAYDIPSRKPERPSKTRSVTQWLLQRTASFLRRPDAPRVLGLMLLLIVVILRPGFVVFLGLMGILTGLVLYFSLGPEVVEHWVAERYRRLRQRDPIAAERLRRRAAAASRRLAALVDRLPDSWTAGLCLPDFEEPSERPEKLNSDPFDRLARQ